MANAELTYKTIILPLEGGYQNRSDDLGNWLPYYGAPGAVNFGTHMGLSAQGFLAAKGRWPKDVAELKQVAEQEGFKIFKWHYWDRVHGDQIKDQLMASFLSDWAFNGGYPQNWIAAHGGIDKINANPDPHSLLLDAIAARRLYLRSLPIYPRFAATWEARLNSFLKPLSRPAGPGILPVLVLGAGLFFFSVSGPLLIS